MPKINFFGGRLYGIVERIFLNKTNEEKTRDFAPSCRKIITIFLHFLNFFHVEAVFLTSFTNTVLCFLSLNDNEELGSLI